MCRRGTWTLCLTRAALVFLMAMTLRASVLAQDYLTSGAVPLTALAADAPDQAAFSILKQVDEVNLMFTVTDSKSHLLSDLSAADFHLLDNHQPPEKIRYFQRQSSLPLQVALLIDTSSSITRRFDFEKKAASVFLKKMIRPGLDQAFIVAFDDEVRLLNDFTDDVPAMQRSLNRLKPNGNTALYDAVVFAADKLRTYPEPSVTRRVIIVITDGEDTKHHAILYDAEQAAIRADSVLFALSTNAMSPGSEYPRGEAVLELLSRATGGSILPAHERSEINHAFSSIEKALRSQYVLGYKPAAFQADGSFHTIELLPRKPHLKVQCRRGYYATKR